MRRTIAAMLVICSSSFVGASTAVCAPKPAKTDAKKRTVKTEAELSGITSETADNLYARINFSRSSDTRQLILRSGYGLQVNRSYNSKGKVSKQDTDTYNLDAQYRIDTKGSYKFVSAYANVKSLKPANKKTDVSGYYSVALGIGRSFAPGLESEISLAAVRSYDKDKIDEVTLVQGLRMKRNLSAATYVDADIQFIKPLADDPLVDSRINLTYKLTDRVGIRLTHVANNLITSTTTRSGWDRSIRLSLTFSSTK